MFVKSPVFPVRAVPGRRHDARARNEVDRRGDGRRRHVRRGLREGAAVGGAEAAGSGRAFISVNNTDKPTVLPIARDLAELGFELVATRGTAAYLRAHGLDVEVVYKVNEGRPNVADQIVNGQIALIVNTPLGRESFFDDRTVRRVAMMQAFPASRR